jgi:hypothetical protein
MAQMDRAIGIRQGTGDQDFANVVIHVLSASPGKSPALASGFEISKVAHRPWRFRTMGLAYTVG